MSLAGLRVLDSTAIMRSYAAGESSAPSSTKTSEDAVGCLDDAGESVPDREVQCES